MGGASVGAAAGSHRARWEAREACLTDPAWIVTRQRGVERVARRGAAAAGAPCIAGQP